MYSWFTFKRWWFSDVPQFFVCLPEGNPNEYNHVFLDGPKPLSLVHSTSSSILMVTEAKVPYAVLWVDKDTGMYMGARGQAMKTSPEVFGYPVDIQRSYGKSPFFKGKSSQIMWKWDIFHSYVK